MTLTVSITIDPPPQPIVAVIEDTPPAGWVASNVSNGGNWDAQNDKVKWGPFWEGSIPSAVTYDVTPTGYVTPSPCFAGIISFGSTGDQPIGGDQCIAVVVPALSAWGLLALGLLLIAAAAVTITRRRRRYA